MDREKQFPITQWCIYASQTVIFLFQPQARKQWQDMMWSFSCYTYVYSIPGGINWGIMGLVSHI